MDVNAKSKRVPDCGARTSVSTIVAHCSCSHGSSATTRFARVPISRRFSYCPPSVRKRQSNCAHPNLPSGYHGRDDWLCVRHVHSALHLHCERKEKCSFPQQRTRTKTSKTPQHHTESQRSICREFSPYSAAHPRTFGWGLSRCRNERCRHRSGSRR